MSPRAAAVIWWALMITYTVGAGWNTIAFVVSPSKPEFAGLALWALVGGRLLFYELKYASTMAAMLKDRPTS